MVSKTLVGERMDQRMTEPAVLEERNQCYYRMKGNKTRGLLLKNAKPFRVSLLLYMHICHQPGIATAGILLQLPRQGRLTLSRHVLSRRWMPVSQRLITANPRLKQSPTVKVGRGYNAISLRGSERAMARIDRDTYLVLSRRLITCLR